MKRSRLSRKFKKGDFVKVISRLTGYNEYGLRKGSVGVVVKAVKLSDYKYLEKHTPAFQVDFPKAGKELTMHVEELRKLKGRLK